MRSLLPEFYPVFLNASADRKGNLTSAEAPSRAGDRADADRRGETVAGSDRGRPATR
ncbi:hypothetical protein [Actinoplanes sp. NPDC051411]|uniref:hypothetical protein n=1 Tax=Actinoplanes sp. NPDC051411 TaxID=3155522 RepID=UPI00342FE275